MGSRRVVGAPFVQGVLWPAGADSEDEDEWLYPDQENPDPDPDHEDGWYGEHIGEYSRIVDDTNGEYTSMLLDEQCAARGANRARLEEAEEAEEATGDENDSPDGGEAEEEEEEEAEREQAIGAMNLDEDIVSPSSPSLMGMPDIVLEAILHYTCKQPSEACALETVCKRLRRMLIGSDFWDRHRIFKRERETAYCMLDLVRDHVTDNQFRDRGARLLFTQEQLILREQGGLDQLPRDEDRLLQLNMQTRDQFLGKIGILSKGLESGYPSIALSTREKTFLFQFQKKVEEYQWKEENEEGENEILAVLGVDGFRTLAADILSRMMPFGGVRAEASFRLRGDTVGYLAEVLQGYMLSKLSLALSVAFNSDRYEVRKTDIEFCSRRKWRFQSPGLRSRPFHCNVSANDHGLDSPLGCSCSFPETSHRVWRWPEGNCHDALAPDAGRRIIRRLAFKAGIIKLSNEAFVLAEADLLHTMGILLVEAYESTLTASQRTSPIAASDNLSYGQPGGAVDMFHVPPPPIAVNRVRSSDGNAGWCDEDEADELRELGYAEHQIFVSTRGGTTGDAMFVKDELLHTIVPGQIRSAAEKRDISPSIVYGDIWVPSSSFTAKQEKEIEESYYRHPIAKDFQPYTVKDVCDAADFAESDKGMILEWDNSVVPHDKSSDESNSDSSDIEDDSSSEGYHTESSVESEGEVEWQRDFWGFDSDDDDSKESNCSEVLHAVSTSGIL